MSAVGKHVYRISFQLPTGGQVVYRILSDSLANAIAGGQKQAKTTAEPSSFSGGPIDGAIDIDTTA